MLIVYGGILMREFWKSNRTRHSSILDSSKAVRILVVFSGVVLSTAMVLETGKTHLMVDSEMVVVFLGGIILSFVVLRMIGRGNDWKRFTILSILMKLLMKSKTTHSFDKNTRTKIHEKAHGQEYSIRQETLLNSFGSHVSPPGSKVKSKSM